MEKEIYVIKINGYHCLRCGKNWAGRLDREPEVCPKCKSHYWNKERKRNMIKT